jgi:hypothetical protein
MENSSLEANIYFPLATSHLKSAVSFRSCTQIVIASQDQIISIIIIINNSLRLFFNYNIILNHDHL